MLRSRFGTGIQNHVSNEVLIGYVMLQKFNHPFMVDVVKETFEYHQLVIFRVIAS